MIWGGSRQWKGNGAVEDEGLVLGEIGEAKGRRMEAGKGVGLLGKKEEDLLKISAERGKGIGWKLLENWRLSPGRKGGHSNHSL